MRITSSIEYSMRVMVRLARGGGSLPVSSETISADERLPKEYADQILRKLRRAGFVSSVRGPLGGYVLAKRPQDIRIGDVVRAFESRILEDQCLRFKRGEQDCRRQGTCGIRPVWSRLSSLVTGYLDGVRLDQVVEEEEAATRRHPRRRNSWR